MRIFAGFLFSLFCFCVLIIAVAPAAHAQASVCRYDYDHWIFDPAIPGEQCYNGWSFAFTLCHLGTYKCPPAHAAGETRCPRCQSHATPTGGKPIALANGDTFIKQMDISLPALGGGLSLTRTWNSQWPASQATYQNFGIFGPNWRSTYEESVYLDSDDGYIRYARADGNFWTIGFDPDFSGGGYHYRSAAPASDSSYADAAIVNGVCTFTLTLSGGEKRTFTNCPYDSGPIGKLASIADRNGNTTTLHYDSSGRLDIVTDAVGRHLYFNYGTGALSIWLRA
jgi:YD repeat-containing protein